ncbi:MAG: DNA repair protein RadA [Clostridia bacterium]|nr:DNA repair protein RadA [Lachnospiraceae bacterium]NCC01494.1 DNA repair protein RadA [Clostridia bacterium]NCD03263.1 DNA repair protein RadA [Clostridia bacterium]
MAKGKMVFYCQSCGYESTKWMGQCPGCREWNTFVEEPVIASSSKQQKASGGRREEPTLLSQVSGENSSRTSSGIREFDRVLGGGIVSGSMVLVGGDPGIGKSTLLLQICLLMAAEKRKVLYISGEESLQQIKLRADRLEKSSGDLMMLCETDLERIQEVIERTKPEMVIIDSIQTMCKGDVSSAPGSVTQVRESTGAFMKIAKTMGVTVFIVGHVTKEGVVAGPRVLEHMVDTVLYFEGERHAAYRILRSVKNRFGSTNEIGVFEMGNGGLKEVLNPSQYLLDGRPEGASGSVVACLMEGTRPVMVEVQALVCRTNFNMPRRTAAGMDYNRVNLLMAVIEKRMGLSLSNWDAYINIAGGMKLNAPALDLAVVTAIISSYKDFPIDENTVVFGEVGLSGEVRGVSMAVQCVQEAKKLGFSKCILPKVNMSGLNSEGIELIGVESIKELMNKLKK